MTTEATVRSSGECIEAKKIDSTGNGGTLDTWNGDYMKVLRKLPVGAPLTADLLQVLVTATKANSRSRQRAAISQICGRGVGRLPFARQLQFIKG